MENWTDKDLEDTEGIYSSFDREKNIILLDQCQSERRYDLCTEPGRLLRRQILALGEGAVVGQTNSKITFYVNSTVRLSSTFGLVFMIMYR